MSPPAENELLLTRPGIDTHQEPVVYMHRDCAVCRSEGFTAHSRVRIEVDGRSIIATVHMVTGDLLGPDEAGLSESAWRLLGSPDGLTGSFSHPASLDTMSWVRGKMHGHSLSDRQMGEILADVAAGRYSDVELAAFMTACATAGLSLDEVVSMTRHMTEVGDRLEWDRDIVADKHCVGGLPGNRTTPLVVAIVASAGLWIPKTSSRAITSPAGTADSMETLCPVDLSLDLMRRVVEQEGGCIAWGGAVRLSPIDDVMIRVERALDIDSGEQLVASVLSKKAAAGSSHVVIDMPVGPTAKVRTRAEARALTRMLERVGVEMGLQVQCVETDGTQPVGRGIGPALEAREVVAVARGDADAPTDLRERAVVLAGALLELAGHSSAGSGEVAARGLLDDGTAWTKLQAICEAQGGMREPPVAEHTVEVVAPRAGTIAGFDNRRLARTAKLAGAPAAKAAGLVLHVRAGDAVAAGEPLLTLHAESRGELDYARTYLERHPGVVRLEEDE